MSNYSSVCRLDHHLSHERVSQVPLSVVAVHTRRRAVSADTDDDVVVSTQHPFHPALVCVIVASVIGPHFSHFDFFEELPIYVRTYVRLMAKRIENCRKPTKTEANDTISLSYSVTLDIRVNLDYCYISIYQYDCSLPCNRWKEQRTSVSMRL